MVFKKSFVYASLLIVCIYGCSNKESDITALYPVQTIKDFGGELFLTDVRSSTENAGFFYFNEFRTNRIFITDSSLNLIHFFGESGKGPGEFQGTGTFFIQNDSLYVYDDGGLRLHVFTIGGEFKRTVNLPPVSLLFKRFAIVQDKIFFPVSVRLTSDIRIVDLWNGEVIDEINLNQNEDSENLSSQTILLYNDQLIAINKVSPFIVRLTSAGEVLEVTDLTGIRVLDPLWNHYRNHQSQNRPERFTTIFMDAYIDGSFLYILCAGWPGRDDFSYIIKLQIDDKKIEALHVFKIQGADPSSSVFHTFAITGNKLIAVEGGTQTISEFDLSVIN